MVGYRVENLFGDGVTDPVEVIVYEVQELGNLDIPYYLAKQASSTQGFWKALANELIEPDADTIRLNARQYLGGRNYCKWVCKTKEDLQAVYNVEPDDIEEIEIPSDAIILSDLGRDGVLYCWKR